MKPVSITPVAHVYHRILDPDSEDSLAKIARAVRPGSRVLDLGAGPGVLGRYLAETLGCVVEGVEYNPIAVAEAAPWYQRLECADLERMMLADCFAGCRYDFIICADILEHLRQPDTLLAQLPALLAPQGQLLLSVPNAAYTGLIAELLAGDFRYRPEGLLDQTHVRFFTRASLLRVLEEQGLRAVALDATFMDLERSEFAHAWMAGGWAQGLPPVVLRALLDRPEALIYQFIVAAVPASSAGTAIQHASLPVPAPIVAATQAELAARTREPEALLSIAIVTYAPDLAVLATVLDRLSTALRHAESAGLLAAAQLVLVDNGPDPGEHARLRQLLDTARLPASVELLSGQGNIGYGAAHNLALHASTGAWHLILNPDVLLEEDALSEGLRFLAAHPEAGLLAPAAWDGQGQRHDLCKAYPSVLDLALRGFAPGWLRRCFQARLQRYELRDRAADAPLWDPPIASGCFMLCQRAALLRVGGFRPDYFLYFEDFDLSLRLAAVTRLVQVPAVRIVHLGGHAARKGLRHVGLFLRAAALFFHRHGWRWW